MNLQEIKDQNKSYKEEGVLEYLFNEEYMTTSNIANFFNVSGSAIRRQMKKQGIVFNQKERSSSKVRLNHLKKKFAREGFHNYTPSSGIVSYNKNFKVKHNPCGTVFKTTVSRLLNQHDACPKCYPNKRLFKLFSSKGD